MSAHGSQRKWKYCLHASEHLISFLDHTQHEQANNCIFMQTAAEEARFDCARKLTEMESRKRYEFLEAMLSSMDAHLRFFERGHEVCSLLQHLLKQKDGSSFPEHKLLS